MSRSHGYRRDGQWTRAYWAWQNMKKRVLKTRPEDGPNYAKNGITICERWINSFENFFADMGDPPPRMVLDRKDNHKGYSPENCRWATYTESSRNRDYPKLCMEAALKIRALYETTPLSQQKIANMFGVHQTVISDVVRGILWKECLEST